MNTLMYKHPLTTEHIEKLKSWGYLEIPSVEKKLVCGDLGKLNRCLQLCYCFGVQTSYNDELTESTF